MKTNLKTITIAALVVSMFAGCASVNPQTGQKETSVTKSVGLGAVVGAAAGALIGGQKGAAIGAAVGGGLGALIGLDQRQRELQAALQTKNELATASPALKTKIVKTVYTNDKGEKAEGLKQMTVVAPVRDTVASTGQLMPSAMQGFAKLDTLAQSNGGQLTIAVPPSMAPATVAAIGRAAPSAKVVKGGDKKNVIAMLSPAGGVQA